MSAPLGQDTDEQWRKEIERRLLELETGQRAPYTSILNDSGVVVTTLSKDGLDIVEGAITVGGGPVRALDIARNNDTVSNVPLTTSEQFFTSSVLTVPPWAVTAYVFGWLVFQMTNGTAGTQRMQFRTEIDGLPNAGAWNHDAPAGLVANTTDMAMRTLTGVNLGSTITVRAAISVQSGTNDTNIIRTRALAFFFR